MRRRDHADRHGAALTWLNASVYDRGAFTLHALRVRVGDDTCYSLG